jgi:hypothetical protein
LVRTDFFGESAAGLASLPLTRPDCERSCTYRISIALIAQGYNLKSCVAAFGGALRVIGAVTSALGIGGQKRDDPWRSAVGHAHPLDYVEVPR